MAEKFWRQENYWWGAIVLLILSGCGWLIQQHIQDQKLAAILVGQIPPPPGKVTIYIDSKAITTTSEFGFYRIDNLPPGSHEIQWKIDGYQPKYTVVEIRGGTQNKVDLPALERFNPLGNATAMKVSDIFIDSESHRWFAGTKHVGTVDISEKMGHIWKCSGGTCILEGPYGTGLNIAACKELVSRVGHLDYYYNDAGMTWSETENPSMLAQCNDNAD
jgi:hypothetical protein